MHIQNKTHSIRRTTAALAALAGLCVVASPVMAEDEEWWDPTDWFNGDEVRDGDADRVGVSYDDEWDEGGDDDWGWDWDDNDYYYDSNSNDAYDPYDWSYGTNTTLYTDGYYDGYFDGYQDDNFGYDYGPSLSDRSNYRSGYTDGYYDGYYDQQHNYQADWTYYLYVPDRNNMNNNARNMDRNMDRNAQRNNGNYRSRDRDRNRKAGDRADGGDAGQWENADRSRDSEGARAMEAANRDSVRIRGTVEHIRPVQNQTGYIVLRIGLEDGRTVTANMGPRFVRKSIQIGDRVTLRGKRMQKDNGPVLMVSRLGVNGEQLWKAERHPAMTSVQ